MSPVWITQSDLGVYAINHNFNDSQVVIQFIADPGASVQLVSGELPVGITFVVYSNTIRLLGVIDPVVKSQTYAFTFKVTNPDNSSAERQFYMQVIENPVPVWISQGHLPSQSETYSYTLNPLILEFSSDAAATVSLLNGDFPSGLLWTRTVINSTTGRIVITGESVNLSQVKNYEWTYRITNPNGTVADRTFYLTIVPLADYPNWSGQQQFLGYVGSNSTAKFQVSAKTTGTLPLVYSLVGVVPQGMTISATSGIITWNAPEVVVNTNRSFTVRASNQVTHSDVVLNATILIVPQPPVWVTPNQLKTVAQGAYLQYPILAFDSQGKSITYTITTAAADFPFTLDPQGLLYGEAPIVKQDTYWTAYITATSSNGSTVRDFNFQVTKVNEAGVLVWRNNTVDILGLPDGCLTVLDIGATSTRTPTVTHGITGGQVPPGLVIDKVQGKLVGFLEYHPVDKDYWFDIVATDGIDSMVRTIHLQVVSQYGYQFASLSIPLTGDIKQQWISTVQYAVTTPDSIPNVQTMGNTLWYPSVNIIKGLNSTTQDPNEILSSIINWPVFKTGLTWDDPLGEMRLSVGPSNTAVADSHYNTLLYREVRDSQSGSDFTADLAGSDPALIKPFSIDNIRTAFVNACGFANAGSGSGVGALAKINPENGSISSVTVLHPGAGYTTHSDVQVVGKGSGAVLRSVMCVVGLEVVDPGFGWVVGEHISLKLGNWSTPADIIVTAVGPSGQLVSVYIITGGAYLEMPIGKLWIKNAAGIISGVNPDLGIKELQIINAGIGYEQDTTSILFKGTEILDAWQTKYKPYIPIALITPGYTNAIVSNSQLSVTQLLDGAVWQVDDLVWSVEGIYWQGTTAFDDDWTTWDGNTTCFEETLVPAETIFDETYNTYDLFGTQFDRNDTIARDARINWGQTGFDNWTTAFEFYATVFDAIEPPKQSQTVIKKIISLQMPQASGNNPTDWNLI